MFSQRLINAAAIDVITDSPDIACRDSRHAIKTIGMCTNICARNGTPRPTGGGGTFGTICMSSRSNACRVSEGDAAK